MPARIKRGGPDAQRVTLSGAALQPEIDVLEVNDALDELANLDMRQAKVAELRFFACLTLDETAEIVGVSRRTVALDWKMAKRWLALRLGEPGA